MDTLLLSQGDVQSLLSMDMVVETVEQAFAAHGRGETLMPHKIYLTLTEGDFRAMPSYIAGSAGIKWVSVYPNNPTKHKTPSVLALYILSDQETGLPLAVTDATSVTAYRTGAAGAVATKYLARPNAKTLGLVGCGIQAKYLLEAHRIVRPDLQVLVTDISNERAQAFAKEHGAKAVSIEEAAGCDVVCTATTSTSIVVKKEWVKPGALINALGADAAGKQELATDIITSSRVVIDELEQATHSGEINVPITTGAFSADKIASTLGEVIVKRTLAPSDTAVTVFDSTGLGIQDLAVVRALYERAKSRGVGQKFAFVPYNKT